VKRFLAILQLLRIDACIPAFFALLVPVFLRTRNLALSFGRAPPLLFICFCTFIANSLDDIEKDRINHPERPLPSCQLTPTFAAVLYFICLFSALFLVRRFVSERQDFWYYGLIALSISYRYVVECFPGLKAFYVAATASFLPLMIAAWYPGDARLYLVVAFAFLVITGTEMCMDIRDRAGDPISFMHKFGPKAVAIFAFSLEALGLLLLLTQIRKPSELVDLLAMASVLAVACLYWFRRAN